MIEELYDSVLSITNQTGYIDRITEKDTINSSTYYSLLRWSANNKFKFGTWPLKPPPYPNIQFSHDEFFRTPFSSVINEEGILTNIYNYGN